MFEKEIKDAEPSKPTKIKKEDEELKIEKVNHKKTPDNLMEKLKKINAGLIMAIPNNEAHIKPIEILSATPYTKPLLIPKPATANEVCNQAEFHPYQNNILSAFPKTNSRIKKILTY